MARDTEEEAGMQWDSVKMAADYDDMTARIVPGMEYFYGAVTDAIPKHSVRVLELGCGTGILTARIRSIHPEAAVICIDSSEAMLAVARQKTELESVIMIMGDIREPWPAGPYDAVVSSFCFPALESHEQQTVLRRAYRALRPGGVCITGCVVRPPTADEEQCQLARWETFMQDAGLDPEEAQRQRASWDGARERIPTPDGFREMLEAAGFSEIRCPYHRGLYAVFIGIR
ncbi:class I SAM-dependent methyltransferase [Methanogenium sp. S4BF]|uniref:class I SAM-dependent methyltransferase n=1 Tax=Methanogenium sp. S4BF TaxID=1789226 RepID=UPI0024161730|nr:class I SAM-dependent methyltransferase [Methanogenium sp. S4BF]WFN35218.1 class I SAM-dependent methyltransferase [Methanogenium sp. S4BF]